MKNCLTQLLKIALLVAVLALPQLAFSAATSTWSGTAGDLKWSTGGAGGNWGGTTPGTTDSIIFGNGVFPASTNTQGAIDNVVDVNFTVGALTYNNTNGQFHTTQIPLGNTLVVNSNFTVGGITASNTLVAFTGGGTLQAGSGANTMTVNNTSANANLDLSTLSNFVFNPGGAGNSINLCTTTGGTETLSLAALSNNITATTLSVGNNNNAGTGLVNLGAGTNILNITTFSVAIDKTSGTIQFNTPTGGLMVRNAAGTGRANLTLGAAPGSGSTTAIENGVMSLNGHAVDLMLGTLTLGNRGGRGGTSASANGFLSFDTGTVDATTVTMGLGTSDPGHGTLSVGGPGMLLVGTGGLSLVGTSQGGNAGTLIVTNGGTVICSNSITKAATTGTGTITLNSGTLNMLGNAIGSSSIPINAFNTTNSTLYLTPGTGGTTVNGYFGTLSPGGTANTINVVSNNLWVTPGVISAYPTTLHLLQYTTMNGVANYVPGPLPFMLGVQLTGQIVDNGGFIDLVITNGPNLDVPTTNVWAGTLNLSTPLANLDGNWTTSTTDTNWVTLGDTNLHRFKNFDAAIFDDTAYTNIVTLSGTISTIGISFSNSVGYTLNGSGGLAGSGYVEMDGSGAVTFSESGVESYFGGFVLNGTGLVTLDNNPASTTTGGVLINSGALQVGNNDTNGFLPTGGLTNNTALLFSRTNSVLVLSAISGGGNVTNLGSGTVILAGANSYAGYTAINAGTVQVGNGGASGAAGGSSIINNGTLIFNLSAAYTNNPDISGAGSVIQNGSGRLTLPTTETYLGDTVINAGTLALSAAGILANSPRILVNNGTFDVSAYAGGYALGAARYLSLNHATLTAINVNGDGVTIAITNSTLTPPITGTVGSLAASNTVFRFTVTNDLMSSSLVATNLTLGGTTNTITMTLPGGLQGYPRQFALMRYTNLTLASDFNVGLNTLAAGYGGYVSNNVGNSSIDLVLTNGPFGVTAIWSGTASPNINWSTGGAGGNWNGLQAPAPTDAAVFGAGPAPAASGTQGEIDNIVDQSFTVSSLIYSNLSGPDYHTTQIPAGVTLSVNGSVTIGGVSGDSLSTVVNATGAGTLQQTNGTLRVQNIGGASSSSATWDLSGLTNFVYNTTNPIVIGVGSRTVGTLILAQTNLLALGGSGGRQIEIGDGATGNSGGGTLQLGQTNAVFVDTLYSGGTKSTGNINFQSGLNNPVAFFRGASGNSSRVGVWSLGDEGAGSIGSSGTPPAMEGTNDFSLGTLDASADLMIIGQGAQGGGTKTTAAGFAVGAGTLDVNTLYVGAVGSIAGETGIGHFEVIGGTPLAGKPNLQVNSQIVLGTVNVINTGVITASLTGVSGSYGVLTVNANGSVVANTIVAGGTSNTRNGVELNGGSLTVSSGGGIGLPGAPVATLSLSDSTLNISVLANSTNAVVGTLTLGGTTNVINIASLPAIASYPAVFKLITYTTESGALNLGLGTLPVLVPPPAAAYLINDPTDSSVKLVLGTVPAPEASFTFDQTSGGSPLTVNFTNTTTGNVSNLLWTFGDSTVSTSTALAPTAVPHDYTLPCTDGGPSSYSITLAVTNNDGIVSTYTSPNQVQVYPVPAPAFDRSDSTVLTNVEVYFTNNTCSGAAISDVLWDFGDGQTSSDQSAFVSHSYSTANLGGYQVRLAVTNVYGFGAVSTPQTVVVTNSSVPAIQGNPRITRIQLVSGTNVLIVGTNDALSATRPYNVMASSALTTARTNWLAVTNGTFADDGGFTNTILGGVSGTRQFFLIEVP